MQWKRKNSPEPTPDSQWDDIPGFDPDKATYVPFDKDAWLRDNGIREIARDREPLPQGQAAAPAHNPAARQLRSSDPEAPGRA